jgi:hypothetical protein
VVVFTALIACFAIEEAPAGQAVQGGHSFDDVLCVLEQVMGGGFGEGIESPCSLSLNTIGLGLEGDDLALRHESKLIDMFMPLDFLDKGIRVLRESVTDEFANLTFINVGGHSSLGRVEDHVRSEGKFGGSNLGSVAPEGLSHCLVLIVRNRRDMSNHLFQYFSIFQRICSLIFSEVSTFLLHRLNRYGGVVRE